jgi:SIT4-associating protein SAP185/190
MPILLSFLSAEHSWATQTSAGDFLKAIITISANASQNEQSCIGPNELTRQLVSQACVEKLINDMLKGGNPLTVGVGIVIEVIRKNNSDYDPDVGAEANTPPSSRDPIYLGTLLRMFATHVPDFMQLILSPNHTIGGGDGPVTIKRQELSAAFGSKIEPLGFDRFKTCELMAELLHCSNMGLLNEIGSDEFVKARDAERERLKVEGKLRTSNQDRRDSEAGDLVMKSSINSRLSGSPDETRKLEVQNASDDDGFEQVTHSGDLGDDAKDDFDEKPDMVDDILTPTKPDTSLSFLDQDSEEFVDEPLSSPQLKPEPESFSIDNQDPDLTVQPLSPSKDLAQQVVGLHFDEDTAMTSPPPGESEPSKEDVATSLEADLENSLKELEPQDGTESTPALQEPAPNVGTAAVQADPIPAISLHPEDKPAPLFAKKTEEPATKTESETVPTSGDGNDDSTSSASQSVETLDTMMADAGDVSSSILMTNPEDQSKFGATDESEQEPVVGDYLKMQFVEHKVVPTILVSLYQHPLITQADCCTGLLLSIPLEQFSPQRRLRRCAASFQRADGPRLQSYSRN